MTLRLILALLACALQAAALLSSQRPPVPGSDAVAVHAVPVVVATTSSSAPVTSRAPRASRSRAPKASATGAAVGDLLDRLTMCESGMSRYAVSGPYHSYFQWLIRTWHDVSGLPGLPEDYDYATQKAAAARIPVSAWGRQFPACSRRIGVAMGAGGGGGRSW